MTSAATLRTQATKVPVRGLQIPVVPGDVIVRRDGSMAVLPDEVASSEAAKLLGCSIRYVQTLCDEGKFQEGRDWRKLPGHGVKSHYRIRRGAVLAMRISGDAGTNAPLRGGRNHF
jgi:hypothetical protein